MKKILLFAILSLAILASNQVKAANYHVNEDAVDQLFNNAVEMSDMTVATNNSASATFSDEKDPIVAIALDFFLGGFGIHRFYMGTETISWILYPITAGGFFGIVPLIDLVVLLINMDDISAYLDNPNFFMWKGEL